jgi:hypothetical protein
MNEEKSKKVKIGSGMAVGIISVGALIFAIRSCKPEPERITTPAPVVDAGAPCPSAHRNNSVCEIDLGEHDPLSPNFSPEDCGFCGDGNILRDPRDTNPETNALEIPSTDPRARQPTPAGAPRRIVCDFDYAALCRNPQQDMGRDYGVLVRPSVDGGAFSFEIRRPTCATTAPVPTGTTPRTGHSGGRHGDGHDTPAVVVPQRTSAPCPSEVASAIRSAVARINNDPPGARTAAHVRDGEQTSSVSVSYNYTVTPPGNISGGTRVSCAVCSGGTYPIDIGRVVVSTSEACTVGGSFSVAVQ